MLFKNLRNWCKYIYFYEHFWCKTALDCITYFSIQCNACNSLQIVVERSKVNKLFTVNAVDNERDRVGMADRYEKNECEAVI